MDNCQYIIYIDISKLIRDFDKWFININKSLPFMHIVNSFSYISNSFVNYQISVIDK